MQTVAETELGRDERQRIAGGLRREGRGARQTGVHLDHPIILTVRGKSVLDIALPHYAEMPHDLYRHPAQEVVLLVRESLRRRDDDALARVDAQRVEILHIADSDAVIVAVAHHFVLDFLPAAKRLLDEQLRRERQCLGRYSVQFLLIVAEAASKSSERVRGAENDGVAYLSRSSPRLLYGLHGVRAYGLHFDLVEPPDEKLAVLGVHNGLHGRAKYLDVILFQNAAAVEFHSAVQRGLPAEGEQNPLRTLLGYDFLHEIRGHGQEIDSVRYAL